MGALQFNNNVSNFAKSSTLTSDLANLSVGPYTIAMLIKRVTVDTTWEALGYFLTSVPATTAGLSTQNANFLIKDAGTPSPGTTAITSTTSTYIVTLRRPTGTGAALTYSSFLKSTGGNFIVNATQADASAQAAAAAIEIGRWNGTADPNRGYIGLFGAWNVFLTDAQQNELQVNWRTSDWWNCTGGQPLTLEELNTTSVVDLAGRATSWTVTGATVSGETLDGWNYDGTATSPAVVTAGLNIPMRAAPSFQ
jgi:hypothetical protein